ncbi:hypothetical protein C4573_02910 [Candidatus Woesearchaeota archaeon]|nr:MAG: hypothetical protein C4573_02910 [Candidatus Woesearchaeota archaeon]
MKKWLWAAAITAMATVASARDIYYTKPPKLDEAKQAFLQEKLQAIEHGNVTLTYGLKTTVCWLYPVTGTFTITLDSLENGTLDFAFHDFSFFYEKKPEKVYERVNQKDTLYYWNTEGVYLDTLQLHPNNQADPVSRVDLLLRGCIAQTETATVHLLIQNQVRPVNVLRTDIDSSWAVIFTSFYHPKSDEDKVRVDNIEARLYHTDGCYIPDEFRIKTTEGKTITAKLNYDP